MLNRDKRYKMETYVFVFETLEYAQNVLKLGREKVNEPLPPKLHDGSASGETPTTEPCHHVTGQDLCRAARDYALHQYGFLAPMVLESLGIRTTGDIGEVVFNLIDIGQMRKTPDDHREDFDDVFDFRTAFSGAYRIGRDEKNGR